VLDHMSPLDAALLELEDEDRHASMAIASVAVLEGPPPGHEQFTAAIGTRLPRVRRLRQKLLTVPLDLDRPVWVDDPDFDVRYHVRRTALPAPGDDEALCRLVARVMSQRLDRDRPLWECWVVEGLADGGWAVITKVHHCMVDGVSGTSLFGALFDTDAQVPAGIPGTTDDWAPAPPPSTLRLTADALRDLAFSPVGQLRLAARALDSPRSALRLAARTAQGLAALALSLVPATASSLSGPIGQHRRYAVGRARRCDIVQVRDTFGVSTNDVVVAAISGAFRTLLLDRGERPDAHTIRSLIPVSIRQPGEEGIYENRFSLMLALLPVDIADPVERLATAHAHLSALKASNEAEAGAAMTALARHEPFPPISLGIRLAFRLPQRSVTTITTNVPGPRQPLYVLGRRIIELLPYVPIADRLRTGVSIMSYCDQVSIGVTTDYRSAPEAESLARAFEDEITALVKAAASASAPTGHEHRATVRPPGGRRGVTPRSSG
jgi:diacylglycerol O-acyltransferase / wax synthase